MKRKTSVPAGRLLKQWRQDQAFLKEYRALDGEFAMAAAMLSARSHARLTQRQLAARMGTTQAVIARWEGVFGEATSGTAAPEAAPEAEAADARHAPPDVVQ